MASNEDIERLVAPAVAAAGLELVDVELTPSPRVLRVRVDAEGGVDLEGLGPLAKTISHLLDETDVVPGGHYDLEVSSPGVERPLRRPDHFRRAIGSRVRLRVRPGGDGPRRVEGLLAEADDEGVVVTLDDGQEPRRVAYDDVERAHTVFDWQAALAADSSSRAGSAARAARRAGRSGRTTGHTTEPGTTEPTEPAAGRERAVTP